MEEREKAVDHRFSKTLVRKLTQLDGKMLDSFMLMYRPSYEFTQIASDYDFQSYIKQSLKRFKKGIIIRYKSFIFFVVYFNYFGFWIFTNNIIFINRCNAILHFCASSVIEI